MAVASPSESAAQTGEEIFDPSEAMSRTCDDLELLRELAELFAEHRDQLLAELTQAVAAGDLGRIAEHSHAIKGSIGTFTTRRPFELARQLEFAGKDRNLAACDSILSELKRSLAALEKEVSQFLASAH